MELEKLTDCNRKPGEGSASPGPEALHLGSPSTARLWPWGLGSVLISITQLPNYPITKFSARPGLSAPTTGTKLSLPHAQWPRSQSAHLGPRQTDQSEFERSRPLHFSFSWLGQARAGPCFAGLSGCHVQREKKGKMVRKMEYARSLNQRKKLSARCNGQQFTRIEAIVG